MGRLTATRKHSSTFRTSSRSRESKTNRGTKRTKTSSRETTQSWSMTEMSLSEAESQSRRLEIASARWEKLQNNANRPLTNSRSGIPSSRTSATQSALLLMLKIFIGRGPLCNHLSPSGGTLARELIGSLLFLQSPSSITNPSGVIAAAAARMIRSISITILICSDLVLTSAPMSQLSGNELIHQESATKFKQNLYRTI